MKLLYALRADKRPVSDNPELGIRAETFSPALMKLFLQGERRSIRQAAVRMLFCIMTRGKAKIYYVKGPDGAVLHTSYLVPKCFKFPFMEKEDYQIGPCFTVPEARGRGLYPCVLKQICQENWGENTVFYMSANSNNTSSIRGIERAGFSRSGLVRETKTLKRYYRE